MPGFVRLKESYDLAIIGGGHAGLQAGLKSGLLNHRAVVIDRGPRYSRSYYAPRMDNIPGFPDGISGHKLLDLQIEQVRHWSERVDYVTPARVSSVQRVDGGFDVNFAWLAQERKVRARAVLLAMGVVDRMPEVGGKIDPVFPWANFALVDFCILCDGHDLPDKKVAVLGHDAYAARLALDLLHFGPTSVEILTSGKKFLAEVPDDEKAGLEEALTQAKVTHREGEITGYDGIREKRFIVQFANGETEEFDRGFSGLGWYSMNQEIPKSLGCGFSNDGYVLADEDSRALSAENRQPIPGLYIAGDQRNGWNQIPEAWATAERAVIHAYSYYL